MEWLGAAPGFISPLHSWGEGQEGRGYFGFMSMWIVPELSCKSINLLQELSSKCRI